MGATDVSRLFISEYSANGCKWIPDGYNRLNGKDVLLFFDEGLAPPNEKIKLQINNLEKHGQAVIHSVEALINNNGNADLKSFILNQIKKNSSWNTYVAFMCWPDMYQDLKEDIEKLVENHGNFKNVKYIKRVQKTAQMSHSEANNIEAMNIADALSSINTSVEESIKESDTNTVDNELHGEEASPSHNKHPPVYSHKDKERNESDGHNRNYNNDHKPKKEYPKLQKSGVRRPQPTEPEIEENIEDIEGRIFQETTGESDVDRDFSEMAQAKARYIDSLYQRLITGIKKYISKETEVTDKQFLEFVMVLLKVDNYKDFQICWNAVGDKNFAIVLNEEAFTYLREEAVYYSRTCEMVYEQDKWN